MSYDLADKKISFTFGRLVQYVSGSYYDGIGNYLDISAGSRLHTGSTYPFTSSWAVNVTTASYAHHAKSASYARSASFALSSSHTLSASFVRSASYARSSSHTLSSSFARSASFALSSSHTLSSSFARSASFALSSSHTLSSSFARSASYALSSSHTLSSSFARTASYAVSAGRAITASYALTASKINNFPFDSISALLTVSASRVIFFQRPTGSYQSAFFDYYTKSGSNQRAGVMFGTWMGSVTTYTEQTTMDIGNTKDISISMATSASNVQFSAIAQTTENWSIKGCVRYL